MLKGLARRFLRNKIQKAKFCLIKNEPVDRLIQVLRFQNYELINENLDEFVIINHHLRVNDVYNLLALMYQLIKSTLQYRWYMLLSHPGTQNICRIFADIAFDKRDANFCLLFLKFISACENINTFYKKYSYLRKYLPELFDCLSIIILRNHYDMYSRVRIFYDYINLNGDNKKFELLSSQFFENLIELGDDVNKFPHFVITYIYKICSYFMITQEAKKCLLFLSKKKKYLQEFSSSHLALVYFSVTQASLFYSQELSPLINRLEQIISLHFDPDMVPNSLVTAVAEGLYMRRFDPTVNKQFIASYIEYFYEIVVSLKVAIYIHKRCIALLIEFLHTQPDFEEEKKILYRAIEEISEKYEDLEFFRQLYILEGVHGLLTNNRHLGLKGMHEFCLKVIQKLAPRYYQHTKQLHLSFIYLPELYRVFIPQSAAEFDALNASSKFILKYILIENNVPFPSFIPKNYETFVQSSFRLIVFDFPPVSREKGELFFVDWRKIWKIPLSSTKLYRFLKNFPPENMHNFFNIKIKHSAHTQCDFLPFDNFMYKYFFYYIIHIQLRANWTRNVDVMMLIFKKKQFISDIRSSALLLKIIRSFGNQVSLRSRGIFFQSFVENFYINESTIRFFGNFVIKKVCHPYLIFLLKRAIKLCDLDQNVLLVQLLSDELIKVDLTTHLTGQSNVFSPKYSFLYPPKEENKPHLLSYLNNLKSPWKELQNPFEKLEHTHILTSSFANKQNPDASLEMFSWILVRAAYLKDEIDFRILFEVLPFKIWVEEDFFLKLFMRIELYFFPPTVSSNIAKSIEALIAEKLRHNPKIGFELFEQLVRLSIVFQHKFVDSLKPNLDASSQALFRIEVLLFRAGERSLLPTHTNLDHIERMNVDVLGLVRKFYETFILEIEDEEELEDENKEEQLNDIEKKSFALLKKYQNFFETSKTTQTKISIKTLSEYYELLFLLREVILTRKRYLDSSNAETYTFAFMENFNIHASRNEQISYYQDVIKLQKGRVKIENLKHFFYLIDESDQKGFYICTNRVVSSFYGNKLLRFIFKKSYPEFKFELIAYFSETEDCKNFESFLMERMNYGPEYCFRVADSLDTFSEDFEFD